jgi:predicted HicB family RNase H-like nuclease
MITLMAHRGIEASEVHFDMLNAVWAGKLHLVRDVVEFRTNQEVRLQAAFEQTVDHYLNSCAALERQPG